MLMKILFIVWIKLIKMMKKKRCATVSAGNFTGFPDIAAVQD